MRIVYGMKCIYWYLLGKAIGNLHYDSKYINGRYFEKWYDVGWRWIVNDYFACNKLHKNTDVKFPVSPFIKISCAENIIFNNNDLHNFQSDGSYFQAFGKIIIGKGTYIGPNVGLITSNHNFEDLNKHDLPKEIVLGENCWLGMNSIILPGVCLGNRTIVGAGSVVTKSFEEGYCVIAGNPAKILKRLKDEKEEKI